MDLPLNKSGKLIVSKTAGVVRAVPSLLNSEITEIVWSPALATNRLPVVESMLIPTGLLPTSIDLLSGKLKVWALTSASPICTF